MEINITNLDSLFNKFVEFIKTVEGENFEAFSSSKYLIHQENYKYSVNEEAKESLESRFWKPEDIGTGLIQNKVNSAIKKSVYYNFESTPKSLSRH